MKSVPQILDDDVPEESEPFLIPDEAPRSSALPLADINKPLPSIHLSSISDPTTPPIVSSDRPTQARRHSSLSRPRSPNAPKTPRTANRVRFDLSSTIVSHDGKLVSESSDMTVGNANGETTTSNGHVTNNKNHRGLAVQTNGVIPASHPVRTWVDDEDHMENQLPNSAQHERLLEGMEAGSVSVALEMDEMDARAGTSLVTGTLEAIKAKSGLRSAFMNMANSIIGAGIIGEGFRIICLFGNAADLPIPGQPYAFKQAGLLAGIILLIGLTIIVDWTIRLIVINSKLSGADSFQATVEHCFGKAGLIAISVSFLNLPYSTTQPI